MKSKSLHHAYRHHLSDYQPDIASGKWKRESIPIAVDVDTGEVTKEKPLYIMKPENMGSDMGIDDKQIGKGSFTILSNQKTGKIALLVESVKGEELKMALEYFGEELQQVKHISSDMSPTYLKLCREMFPDAQIVVDKFHVMQYVYDALQQVRMNIKKKLTGKLSKQKTKTTQDQTILSELELLKRTRYLLNKSKTDWTLDQQELMSRLFHEYSELNQAYEMVHEFKQWYSGDNVGQHPIITEQLLYRWYEKVEISMIKEFKPVIKMIMKHEENIINFFKSGLTNAKAERINGKIKRFIANNYGMRDKDFALFRIKGYFS